jgi:hypothetical protein
VVGTGTNTGGGGGSPFTYEQLREYLGLPKLAKREPDERQPSFDITARRIIRVRDGASTLLEGTGVIPEWVYTMTREDVLPEGDKPGNSGLIGHALQVLEEWRRGL